MSFLTIKNLKKKEKDIQSYLANRNKIKTDFANQKIFDNELKYETEKLFEPVTNTLNKTSEIVLLNQKKINDFTSINQAQNPKKLLAITQQPQLSITPQQQPITLQPQSTQPTLPTPLKPQIVHPVKVGKLISTYLSDNTDRSTAGYSIKYRSAENKFSIGNSYIGIHENTLNIRRKTYTGTTGLMELLTKANPDMNKIIEEDLVNYKQILDDTNAIYTGFDRKNRVIPFNNSSKFKLIRDKLFPEILKSTSSNLNILDPLNTSNTSNTFNTSGNGITEIILSSNPNDLVDQLKLSVSSFNAGNNGEYNRINSILDLLYKKDIIGIDKYKKIYSNIFS